jgi:hypothetical protein
MAPATKLSIRLASCEKAVAIVKVEDAIMQATIVFIPTPWSIPLEAHDKAGQFGEISPEISFLDGATKPIKER